MKYKSLNLNYQEDISYDMSASSILDCVELLSLHVKAIEQIYLEHDLELHQKGIQGFPDILRVTIINIMQGHKVDLPILDLKLNLIANYESKELKTLDFSIDYPTDMDNVFEQLTNVLIVHLASSISDVLKSLNIPIGDMEIIEAVNSYYHDILTEENCFAYDLIKEQLTGFYKNN